MDELGIVLVRGLGTGCVFALVAMSLNVLYNSSEILNFAQGDWLVVGGVLAFLWFDAGTNLAVWVVLIPIVAIIVALLMAVQGLATLLPLRSSVEQHSWLVTTLAASIIIQALVLLLQGPAQMVVPDPFGTFGFLGVKHPILYPILMIVAVGSFFALEWFHSNTLTGLTMRALRQDLDAARAAGARVRRLQVLSFAIAGLMLGAVGFLGAPILGISQSSGIDFVLNGFIVAVIGGLGNQLGALVSGPILGAVSTISTLQIGEDFKRPVTLAILIAILIVRSEGLFGRPAARRV